MPFVLVAPAAVVAVTAGVADEPPTLAQGGTALGGAGCEGPNPGA